MTINRYPRDGDASGVGNLEEIQATQKRALAAAGGADNGNQIASLDVETHSLENGILVKTLMQVFDGQQRFRHIGNR